MQPREAAGGVVVGPHKKIALVEQHGNSWALPKGSMEKGETLLETARREVEEETGLTDLAYISNLGSYERKSIALSGMGETDAFGVRKRTFFLFSTKQAVLSPRNDPDQEITQACWVTLDEALRLLTHPKDREFLASVRGTIEAVVE